VTILSARELVDERRLPARVTVCYYDELSYQVDSEELAELSRRLAEESWRGAEDTPALCHRGVWLPEVLAIARGIVCRLELAEPLGAVREVFERCEPARVVLLSGASVPERMARLLAERDGVRLDVAMPRFVRARLYAAAQRTLPVREERLRVRDFLNHPRERPPEFAGGRPRILFVTCRPRHHFVVDPLVAAVRAAGAEACVLATPSADPELRAKLEALRQAGVTVAGLADYLPGGEAQALLDERGPALDAACRGLTGGPDWAGRLQWRGLGLEPLTRPFLRDSMRWSLSGALLFQEAAFRALDSIRPAAVVITSNRRHAERAMALAAQPAQIPCVVFSGSSLVPRDRTRLFDIGDRMLVMGRHLKERLVAEQGASPARITVVGDPRSNLARLVPPRELREAVVRDLGLAPGRPLFVLVSKYVSLLFSIHEKEALYRTVFPAIRRLGNANLVVKVHPNEDLSRLREQVKEWECGEAVLTKDYDIHRLFGAADAAVMVTSMAGVEAMALGCPVVAVQAAGKDYEGGAMPPYVSEGVVERVDMADVDGLAGALERLVRDGAHRRGLVERATAFASRYVHPVDGTLGGRLLAVIEEIRAENLRNPHGLSIMR
jgi:hypothetical protein